MATKAKYDLKDVFELIEKKEFWFSVPKRSVDEVMRVYANTHPKDVTAAKRFIVDGILSLSDKNFYRSELGDWKIVVDIYGLIYDNLPWYVKFAIEKEEDEPPCLNEISFHPPAKEFVTTGGIKIPAENTGDQV